MSRTLSTTALTAMTAEETGEVLLLLLTLDHAGLDNPIRVVNDLVSHTSRTKVFTAYPFQITLPIDDGETFPRMQLTIDNVDLTLVETARTLVGPISVLVEVVLASDMDYVEMSLQDMIIREIQYDASTITASIYVEDMLNQAFPNRTFNQRYFPGMF